MIDLEKATNRFWDWYAKVQEDAPKTVVGRIMTDAGYKIAHTGGGCLSWEKILPTGGYLWICDEGNGLGNSETETYLVGRYTVDGEEVAFDALPNLRDAMAWCRARTDAATWFELSRDAAPGSRVTFVEAHDIYPECVVPAGMKGTVKDNGLNEIHGGMLVTPDDEDIRKALALWDGDIQLGYNEGLDPAADGATDASWQAKSPIVVTEAKPWAR